MTEEVAQRIVRNSIPVRQFDNLGEVAAVAVFPDGRRMATNSSDGMLRVWDLKNGAILKEMEGHGDALRDMALSRDGQLIAISDCVGYVSVWHGDTGRPLTQPFRAHSNTCSLDFSPDGATLATGSQDHRIKLWSTETWKLRWPEIRCNYVNCVRYSPSGELLAIATDNDIEIWNSVTVERVASLGQVQSVSLLWTPDGTRLLSGDDRGGTSIREWDSSWKQVGDIWKGHTGFPWCFAVNCNGTIVASPTEENRVRLWQLSDRRTIAIFQHSDFPYCITFSTDGRHIFAGGKDKKISEWKVPEHAWPDNASNDDQATYQAQDCDTEDQPSDSKAQDSDADAQYSENKIVLMSMTVRNACIRGDLLTAESLLTQAIHTDGDSYRSYANRSVVMARQLNWDQALRDATKSLGIQPSFIGYISQGIALCGKKQVRNASKAFDLASTFTDGDPKTIHFLFLVKAMGLFNASRHADAIRRVRELAAACPNVDTTLACRVVEVYMHIQLGNSALDRACPAEAADHFTAAVNAGTFLTKSAVDFKYEEFVVLFGCDFTSLWKTANQKRCHALLRAGRLVEVFEAFRYMADMSDETTKASCLDWSIGFMQELSSFRDSAPNANATTSGTPDMCKSDDENYSVSDIDSDLDPVDDVVC